MNGKKSGESSPVEGKVVEIPLFIGVKENTFQVVGLGISEPSAGKDAWKK